MLTRLSFKISFFAALMTFVYCFILNIPPGECFKRSFIVFCGFYLILISFFISLRVILKPGEKQEAKSDNRDEDEESEQLADANNLGVEFE